MGGNVRREADVCVIGCGPAGITVARELAATGARVIVVEAGGIGEAATGILGEGRAVGPVIKGYPTYLRDSRRFQVGGAGVGWGRQGRMWCIPFSPIDFAPRDWVPNSGWPITAAELAPYSERAAALLGLPPFGPARPLPDALAAGGALVGYTYHFPPDSGILRHTFMKLAQEEAFRAELHAVAVGFAGGDGRVEAVRLRRADGSARWIEADTFVLAAGGIENARILLLESERRGQQPLPALGRYFMEHFHVYAGRVRLPDAAAWAEYLGTSKDDHAGHGWMRVLGFTDQAQRDERLLNTTIQLVPEHEGRIGGPLECAIIVRAEQVPNPDSRVELADQRDSYGRRQPSLGWWPTQSDWESVVKAAVVATDELSRGCGARAELAISRERTWPWPPAGPITSAPTWGNHHMGTTRMHPAADLGVSDANCRARGMPNVYVAGSSLFPTSSFANPTFTIIALAIRLADHLADGGRYRSIRPDQ